MGKLDGKTAVITGASRGIGAEIARLFATEGARVVCAARTLHEGDHQLEGSLDKTVTEIRNAGGDATAVEGDISVPENCTKLIQAARAAYGPVDVLVNNAALTYHSWLKDMPLNRWMRSFALNVHAPFILSQLALEDMVPRQSGSIVNISSIAAAGPGRGPYAEMPKSGSNHSYGVTKAALERLTQGLAYEVAQYNVSVTCLSPSRVVGTPGTIFQGWISSADDPRGEPPSMMARATLLLSTEPPDNVTGRVTYSQHILHEFGWITDAEFRPADRRLSGFSQI